MVHTTAVSGGGSANMDPLRVFLDQHATSRRLLFESEDVQATLYTLRDGTQLVLKVTSADRADFEWVQLANEVKAAKSVPHSSSLGQQLAWQEAADGRALSVSIYAGPTVEALLQEPAARGGWADLQLWQRVEVVRDLLAGGVHALMRMRPWLHFDVKPANVAVLPCPGGGPPHITLLDMGAVTHSAALHTPQRSSLYPVVSMDHMDVALITMQPGEVQLPYETKQGCRDALSLSTDVFTLGLLAYKVLLGPNLPPEMDWDSNMYQPGGPQQEQRYVSEQQRLARDLAAGISSHPGTRTLLQQLPQDCLQVLGRMCDPNPGSRAQLQEVAGMGFIQRRLVQLGVYSTARDAAYAAAKQGIIDMLQDIPGIQLAARPSSRVKQQVGLYSGRSSIAGGAPADPASQAISSSNVNSSGNYNSYGSINSSSNAHLQSGPEYYSEAEGPPPPGAFTRLPRGTNAAREAAAAAAAAAAAMAPGAGAKQSAQAFQQHVPNRQQQPQGQGQLSGASYTSPQHARPSGQFSCQASSYYSRAHSQGAATIQQQQQRYPSGAYESLQHAPPSARSGYEASGYCMSEHSNCAAAVQQQQQHGHPSGACQLPQGADFRQFGSQAKSYYSTPPADSAAAVVQQYNSRVGQQQEEFISSTSTEVYTSKPKQQQQPAGEQGSIAPLGFGQHPALSTATDAWGRTSNTANGWGGTVGMQLNNSRAKHEQHQQQQQEQHEGWDEPPGSPGPPGFAHRQHDQRQQQHEGWGTAPQSAGTRVLDDRRQQQQGGWGMKHDSTGRTGFSQQQHEQQPQHEGRGMTAQSSGTQGLADRSRQQQRQPQQQGWAMVPHTSGAHRVADRQQRPQQQHGQEGWDDAPDSGPPGFCHRQHEQQQGGDMPPGTSAPPSFTHKQPDQQEVWDTAPNFSRAPVHTNRQQQQQQQHEGWSPPPGSPGPPGFAQRQHRPSDDGRVLRDQQWQQAAEECPPGFGMPSGRRGSQAGNTQQQQQQGKPRVHDDSHWQQGLWQQCGFATGAAPNAGAPQQQQVQGTSVVMG